MKSMDASRLFLRSWLTILVVCFASSPQPAWAQAGSAQAATTGSDGQNPPPAAVAGASELINGAGALTASEFSPDASNKEETIIILARVVLPDYPVRPRTTFASLPTPVEMNPRIQLSGDAFTFSIKDIQRVRKEHFLKLFRTNFEEPNRAYRSTLFSGHQVRFDEGPPGTSLPAQP